MPALTGSRPRRAPRRASPWYAGGLRFECTRCGRCCTGEGYVWLSDARIDRIAAYLGISPRAFLRRHVRLVGDRLSLVEKANTDCVFWEREAGCTIYEVRPTQCRTFPFWPENLESPADWEETAAECPGAGRGRLHGAGEILVQLRRNG